MKRIPLRPILAATTLLATLWAIASGQTPPPSIHFAYQPIGFRLESCETPQFHAPETMAGGVAVFDYNNDGHLDIFFTNGADILTLKKSAAKYSNRLFENDGKGNFKDVTAKAGLAGTGYDNGVAVGDYDNDGFPDLFVGGVHGNHLYRNNGNGTFTDVTAKALPGGPDPKFGPLWSVGGACAEPKCEAEPGKFDYCHPKFYKATPNQLFLNNGDGTFRDASADAGIRAHPGKGMGAAVADFDLDGLPDIFVSNDKMENSFFHNKGGGKFEETGFEAGVALTDSGKFISGMGVDARDLDNDGLPDLVFVALDFETFPLFRNLGKRGFADVTATSGMARLSVSMAGYSPTIADFDNDGWKDIFVTRGHVQSLGYATRAPVEQPNTVFRAVPGKPGAFRFDALTAEAGLTAERAARHRGSAIGDFDGDGRMDIVVTAISAPAEIWHNDTPSAGHWIAFQLQGTKSNRDGIGATIKLTAAGATQYQHVSFAAGYASSSAGPTHFGLGAAKTVDLVEIRWPSGITQQLRNLPAGAVVKVQEPR
jgi:hypothetical protein